VTGVDEGMFFQLLLLGELLRRYGPDLPLHVCAADRVTKRGLAPHMRKT
jgi:hypothetical protein